LILQTALDRNIDNAIYTQITTDIERTMSKLIVKNLHKMVNAPFFTGY
jgi:hypothetical protein